MRDGFFEGAIEQLERQMFLDGLREREARMMELKGDCTCAAAPTCPLFRRQGELFENGLPEGFELRPKQR